MAAPVMTLGTTLHASASLGAATSTSDTLDLTTKFEGQVMYKVTAGGTVSGTHGLRIEVFQVYSSTTYGSAGTGPLLPNYTYTMLGWTASQVTYSPKIFLPTGKHSVKITNLDASQAVTVEAIYDTVDSIT